ncbi:hypothetical protein PPYR_08335 [Photinus pyralis]|uniref:Exosome complex component 10 homolog n=2 Tax=Photinus pyralis TaxID=7054 RepID=A0A1Y1KTQ2_PHOPY|nr:exosome component 10 [Photinus pyralis]KAB0797341.1 hypothetical protein PPYR_08335 [Photinus pyralis]
MEETTEIIPGFPTINDYKKKGFELLLEATKSSNALPSQREWDFYKTYDSFNKILNKEGDKVLRLMSTVLHNQQQNVNIRNRDMDERMEMLIEANDNILEKVAISIDELNGIKRANQGDPQIQAVSAQLPVNGSWNQLSKATFSVSSSIDGVKKSSSFNAIRLLTAKNIVRPQSYFKDKIDNSNNPWIPRITEKPNSIKPLAIFLEESELGEQYSHPYEMELEHFTPPANQLLKIKPENVKPLEETPLVEVSTPEDLEMCLEDLRQHTEFAVDLEHHSYRTFMGITCLLQISTKDTDYLIDTFTLRDKLCILNEVFTKPSIVKIFHGADMDVQWLQRDLSLYVVNMFDTHQAAKQLGYSGLSLAYLLNKFCNVVPNKHFQLADWRIRPLPDELKTYARMDTHYLIYIYYMLRNALLNKGNGSDNVLKSVISESTEICKKRYVKPILTEESHMDFYRKCKRMFDNRQMFALRELFRWRDKLARAEDESTGYILPNHMLLQIAEALPREVQGIIASCNPVPPLVRANLLEIHQTILKAREQSLTKPILNEDNRGRGSTFRFAKLNVDSPLHCPHDLSKSTEFRDDLPTLLGQAEYKTPCAKSELQICKSKYSVFNVPEIDSDDQNDTLLTVQNKSLLAPYQRYELIKPFIRAEEEKATVEAQQNEQKELSNEDRIAALHEHFVKVAKETPQILAGSVKLDTLEQTDVVPPPSIDTQIVANILESHPTLKSMCGSKKRKRAVDEIDVDEPEQKIPHNEIHTPKPQQRHFQRRKNKKKNQQFQDHTTQQHSQPPNKPKQPPKKQWKQKQKQRQPQKQSQNQQFQAFDYSSVNFQQFQGGAGRSNNRKGFPKNEFKGKNNKKKNNKQFGNKSMTYSRRQ